MELNIERYESEETLPLYCNSGGQDGPAYLYLDTRDGNVWVNSMHPAYANSWGVDEHNGHVRRWSIPNNLTVVGINQLLGDNFITDRLTVIIAGAIEHYDGSNYRTRLTDEAACAEETLERYVGWDYHGRYDALDPWCAEQWLSNCTSSDLFLTGESTEQAASRIGQEALKEGVYLSKIDLLRVLANQEANNNGD